jgi:hypothetical protein
VPFGNVSLTVYAGHDIVSNNLAGWAHSWEKVEMREMLWALREYKVGLAREGGGKVCCLWVWVSGVGVSCGGLRKARGQGGWGRRGC